MNREQIRTRLHIGMRFMLGSPLHGKERRHAPFLGAAASIAISLVPLYLVLMVSNGMIQGITERYLETRTAHLQLAIPFGISEERRSALLEGIQSLDGVVLVRDEIAGMGLAVSSSGSASAEIRALDMTRPDEGFSAFMQVMAGHMLPSNSSEIVLGKYLARELRVQEGDLVSLVTQRNSSTPVPRVTPFKVAGIVSTGYRELDAHWCFVRPDAARRMLSEGTGFRFLAIKIRQPFSSFLAASRERIQSLALDQGMNRDWDGTVRTWQELEYGLFKSFVDTRSVLLVIMALVIAVAALNLSSVLSTFAMEHRMDIAILKACGASRNDIAASFLGGGMAAALAGVLVGTLTGLALSLNINAIIRTLETVASAVVSLFEGRHLHITLLNPDYYLETIPVRVPWNTVILISVLTLLVSLLASVLPALKAADIPPAEIVRKE
ncbi:MAG: FtsX-like permease family protein [Spirochaetaceae bacterium]|nr:FtsX-like permease family protein [Spirochaetaceae bacterium]